MSRRLLKRSEASRKIAFLMPMRKAFSMASGLMIKATLPTPTILLRLTKWARIAEDIQKRLAICKPFFFANEVLRQGGSLPCRHANRLGRDRHAGACHHPVFRCYSRQASHSF